jgi:hypothetical protein
VANARFQQPSSAPPPPPPDRAPTAHDRSTAFKPVEGGSEMQSGEKLLVEAYAAIWVILFVLLFLGWRRQQRIDARVASLESAIEKARGDGKGATGAAGDR